MTDFWWQLSQPAKAMVRSYKGVMTFVIARTDYPQYCLITISYGSFEYLYHTRTQRHPEGTVCIIKGRSTPLLKKRSHLLTESYVLNNQVGARAESRSQDADGK